MFLISRTTGCYVLLIAMLSVTTGCSVIFKANASLKGPWAHMYHSELSFSIDYPAHWNWSTATPQEPRSVLLESSAGSQAGKLTITTLSSRQWWQHGASLESFIAESYPLLGPSQREKLPNEDSHIIMATIQTSSEHYVFTLHPNAQRIAVLEFSCSRENAEKLEATFYKMARSFHFATE